MIVKAEAPITLEYMCMHVYMSLRVCVHVCMSRCLSVYVCSVEHNVDGRLYITHQLLAAVVAKNIYDETKDALNGNKTRSWLSAVADWILSLDSR